MTSSGLQTETPASGPGLPPQEVGGASIGASSGSEELNKQFLASLDSAQVRALFGVSVHPSWLPISLLQILAPPF